MRSRNRIGVFHIDYATDLEDVHCRLREQRVNLLMIDMDVLAQKSLSGALLRLLSLSRETAVVLLCDYCAESLAFSAVGLGAHDYILRERDEQATALRVVSAALQRGNRIADLQFQAHHDELTQLGNRGMLEACLEATLAREEGCPAVLYLDLDGFKPVNDRLGHAAGDEVLRVVGERLREVASTLDVVARMGGDEFAILVEHAPHRGDMMELAGRVLKSLEQPIPLSSGQTVAISCSIGIAHRSEHTEGGAWLLKAADRAMYQAKRSGPGVVRVFNGESSQRLALGEELGEAFRNHALEVYYQPQFAVDGSLFGMEALLRWPRENGEILPPSLFVPLLEESGAIVDVGRWVMRTALQQLQTWREEGMDVPKVSINISPVQLDDGDFVRDLMYALKESNLSASSLELEVTEAMLLEHPACSDNLQSIREAGVRVALDNFGDGGSSLHSLLQFPLDTLKLDRSVVAVMQENAKIPTVVRSLLQLGYSFGMATVAEGVETAQQAHFLFQNGCHALQGYLYAPPTSASNVRFNADGLDLSPRTAASCSQHPR